MKEEDQNKEKDKYHQLPPDDLQLEDVAKGKRRRLFIFLILGFLFLAGTIVMVVLVAMKRNDDVAVYHIPLFNMTLTVSKYTLKLRMPFGTSHATTTQRDNVLIEMKLNNITAYAEVGLPPKIKHVYYANFADVMRYIKAVVLELKQYEGPWEGYNPYVNCSDEFFQFLRKRIEKNETTMTELAINSLFEIIDELYLNKEEYSLPARSGLELVMLDYLGKYFKQPIYQLVGGSQARKPGFYTVALNENMTQSIESLRFGMNYTPFIKVKLDGNLTRSITILTTLFAEFNSTFD